MDGYGNGDEWDDAYEPAPPGRVVKGLRRRHQWDGCDERDNDEYYG